MTQKRLDFTFLVYIVIMAILFMITMESSINLYLTDEYNPNYYIYQALLYTLAGFVVIKNRRQIDTGGFIRYIWIFCLLCFLTSLIRIQTVSFRGIIALFFNTCIIPFAILNGHWLGDKLSVLKDRDVYLLVLQIPVLYSMFLLRSFNLSGSWFDADAAFVVIVFLPFVFFFRRNWLSVIFALIYIVFAFTAAKRSILLFVAFCLVIYLSYLLFAGKERRRYSLFSRLLVLIVITGGIYYMATNENSGLMHAIERTESLGGITDDNGRLMIYNTVSSAIINSDVFSALFGHGHMAVKDFYGMGAHNDILEICYDYGIIAALMYIFILLHYLLKTWMLFNRKNLLAATRVGISISSIVILGMLNCIVVSTLLVFTMFLALGCAITLNEELSLKK